MPGHEGTLVYGVLSQGPEGSDATIELDELVPSEHVEKAFEEGVPSPSAGDAGADWRGAR